MIHTYGECPVWGMRVEKPSKVAFVFQVLQTIQGKTKARDFAILAPRLYWAPIAIITPMCQPAHVAESGPRARLQVLQNSGSWMFIFRVKPCQREIATDEIQEKKIIESAAI